MVGSATVTSSVANNIAVVTIKTSTIVSTSSAYRSHILTCILDPLLYCSVWCQYPLHWHICICRTHCGRASFHRPPLEIGLT